MIDNKKLSGKHVHIKFVGGDTLASPVVKSWEESGIWVEDETLHKELALRAKQQGVPDFLGRNPLIFLPLHRIDWVMLAEKDSH